MRRYNQMLNAGRARYRKARRFNTNKRLAAALNRCAELNKRTLLFEMATFNPISKQEHYLELWHESHDGNGKFTFYLDGVKWRSGLSSSRFTNWLVKQIPVVKTDCRI